MATKISHPKVKGQTDTLNPWYPTSLCPPQKAFYLELAVSQNMQKVLNKQFFALYQQGTSILFVHSTLNTCYNLFLLSQWNILDWNVAHQGLSVNLMTLQFDILLTISRTWNLQSFSVSFLLWLVRQIWQALPFRELSYRRSWGTTAPRLGRWRSEQRIQSPLVSTSRYSEHSIIVNEITNRLEMLLGGGRGWFLGPSKVTPSKFMNLK